MFTFKDGNLKTLWENVEDEVLANTGNEKIHFLLRTVKQRLR
jgi:hypothetical protein